MEAIPDPHGRSAKGCEKFFDDSELAHFWLSFTRIPADPQTRSAPANWLGSLKRLPIDCWRRQVGTNAIAITAALFPRSTDAACSCPA